MLFQVIFCDLEGKEGMEKLHHIGTMVVNVMFEKPAVTLKGYLLAVRGVYYSTCGEAVEHAKCQRLMWLGWLLSSSCLPDPEESGGL